MLFFLIYIVVEKFYLNIKQTLIRSSSSQTFFKIGVLKKTALWHRCFPVKFSKLLGTRFFTENLRWLLLSFLKKSKNEKIHSHEHIHRKTPVMVSSLVQLQPWGLTILRKRGLHLRCFCEMFEVLQNLSFTEDSWTTASDFQQHFRHITFSISNKST